MWMSQKKNLNEVMLLDFSCQRYSISPAQASEMSPDELAIIMEVAVISNNEEIRLAKKQDQKNKLEQQMEEQAKSYGQGFGV